MKDKRIHLTVSLALIALTVGFIWVNSALPGQDSSQFSEKVRDLVEKVLAFIHMPQSVADFLLEHIRKVAHAVEYAVIGFEIGFLWSGLGKGVQGLWNAWSMVLAISVFDETIQLFATSRGPQITDVLLDTAAGTCAILFVYFIAYIIHSIGESKE